MKRLALIVTILLTYACAKEEIQSVQGTAVGITDGTEVYIQELGENNKMIPLDTAVVTNETFKFKRPTIAGKGLNILSVAGVNGRLLLVQEAAPLSVTIYKDSVGVSKVTGGRENELFNNYVLSNRARNVKKTDLQQKANQANAETDGIAAQGYMNQVNELDESFISENRSLIEEHPSSVVSVIALSDLINAKVLKIEESETYFNSLDTEIQNSTIGTSIKNYIAQLKSQRIAEGLASIGNKAPDFTAPTPDGKQLSLSETLGKYTIIDFWASWCRPCRMENPNVVNVYKKYHDKGLNIISVSLDKAGQDQRWKDAIQKDEMDWYHVSNLQFWQDPIAKAYGIRSIPATYLLDENGVIIAKNLRGAALGKKMEELLGQS
ncbi:AhpC/TSA family protein [Dokdonia sinensis]|uniref:AhpC/TSA family protein n=1 Tax=Dokdonia sinensis TaxID=2479847 RepID=A0A3M0GQK7_9FLAO|nr:TlpA disulfide reductase family protein [Dokdonia sinensis]RMB59566.1 AhpC/TSA family protein [Dokdonia sinensis]